MRGERQVEKVKASFCGGGDREGRGGGEPGEERGRFLGRHEGQRRRWLRGRGPEVRGQVKQRTESQSWWGQTKGKFGQ